MILPFVTLPEKYIQSEEKNDILCAFVSHLSILGPVLLLGPGVATSEDLLMKCLYMDAALRRLYADGFCFSEKDEESVLRLLNNGLSVAFFRMKAQDDDESVQRERALTSFPRTRVGLSQRLDVSAGTNEGSIDEIDMGAGLVVAFQGMRSTVESNAKNCAHFLFELYAGPKSDLEALAAAAKSLTRDMMSLGLTVEIYFQLVHRTNIADAVSMGMAAPESVHACVQPRLQNGECDKPKPPLAASAVVSLTEFDKARSYSGVY